jgi:hypothetical protein
LTILCLDTVSTCSGENIWVDFKTKLESLVKHNIALKNIKYKNQNNMDNARHKETYEEIKSIKQ